MNNLETIAILFASAENKPTEFYEILSKYGADNIFKEAAEELDKSWKDRNTVCVQCKAKVLSDARSQVINELDNKFRRECEKYDRLSDDYGQLKESYDILGRECNTLREQLEGLSKDHLSNIDATEKMKKERDILEQKYWDAQRTIDQYDRDLERERHFHNFWQKRYYEAVDERMKLKKETEKPNDKIIVENLRLHNELALAKMRENEQKRYLEAYQKLYVDEVIKNNNLKAGKSEPEKDDVLAKQNCKLLDILMEKIKENVIKEEGE